MTHTKAKVGGLGLLGLLALFSPIADGWAQTTAPTTQEASVSDSTDGVFVVDVDLRTLLTEFSRRLGVRSQLSEGISGAVRNTFLPTQRTRFLEEVASRYGVEWYFEGATLHLSSQRETITRIIGIKSLTVEYINSQIEKADIDPGRYPLQPLPEANAAIVTGPPSYIARVEVIVESILKAQNPDDASIQVIKYGVKTQEDL